MLHGPRVSWGWGQRGVPMVVPRRPWAGPGESWKELYRHCRGGCHQGTLVPAEKQPKTVLDGGECLRSQLPESSLRGVAALAPSLASVSRWWWWLCTAQEKTWAECCSGETEILPQVRRVHGSALSMALKSPLGFARSSQQHNYQIMPPNWSCRLGRQTLAREAIDSRQTASQDRETVWSLLLCSFLAHTSYDHHDTGIQQFHDIKCFIIAGCVVQLSAQGGTRSGELWMRRTQSVNTGERLRALCESTSLQRNAFPLSSPS